MIDGICRIFIYPFNSFQIPNLSPASNLDINECWDILVDIKEATEVTHVHPQHCFLIMIPGFTPGFTRLLRRITPWRGGDFDPYKNAREARREAVLKRYDLQASHISSSTDGGPHPSEQNAHEAREEMIERYDLQA
ncbi:hypothetical protein PISMIDRAFT_17965, partial [Pisolithus microcarpus 441]